MDDCFQFVDCQGVDFDEVAKDIRSGVIKVKYSCIVIAIGNMASLDNFTNVVVPAMALVNAIIDRYGCMKVKIWVTNLIPHPDADAPMLQVMRKQNGGLMKSVNALVRRKKYPVNHITSHKWFLKRVKNEDGTLETEVDQMLLCQWNYPSESAWAGAFLFAPSAANEFVECWI